MGVLGTPGVSLAMALALCTGDCAGLVISYTLRQQGRVSLAIYDGEGVQVRTLMSAVGQHAGEHTVVWDGLDRRGLPVPAGEYTWKLLRTEGLRSRYVMSLGTSVR
ncbi:MAG: FlgD immunoglobulin-like domain containing protein, partial [Phycisphaerae bacterium]